jgi:hypothetical protein
VDVVGLCVFVVAAAVAVDEVVVVDVASFSYVPVVAEAAMIAAAVVSAGCAVVGNGISDYVDVVSLMLSQFYWRVSLS